MITVCFCSFCVGYFINVKNLKLWHLFVPSIIGLIILYIAMIFIFKSNYLNFIYCSFGGIIYALYIAVDTFIIKEEFEIDDYICSAILLTIDILRLFIYILYILGSKN